MVPSSFDTVRCVTHSAGRSMTGQLGICVVRCGRSRTGGIHEQEEKCASRDVDRLRRDPAARGVDVRGNVASEQLEQQHAARRHEGLDQDRHSARRLRRDQGLRRLHVRRHRGDQQGLRRQHQQERRDQRAEDRSRLQEVPADSGPEAGPAVAVHLVRGGRQGLRGGRGVHRLHRPGPGVREQGPQARAHRPRARSAVHRRGARRARC